MRRAAAAASAEPEPEMAATVAIEEFTFVPGGITVPAGGEVTWSNADASNHNVVFDDAAQKGIPNIREGQEDAVAVGRRPMTPTQRNS